MNEMASVPRKGSWVTTMVNTRAGSRGARRAQSADRRSAPPGDGVGGAGGGGGGFWPRPRLVLTGGLIPLPFPRVVLPASSLRLPLPVAPRRVLGGLLPPVGRPLHPPSAPGRGGVV